MILTSDLKSRVEEEIGAEICPAFFRRMENRSRAKLDRINERAGRQYGEDGYGDEYLVILTVEAIHESAFSAWTYQKSAEILAARAAALEGGEYSDG